MSTAIYENQVSVTFMGEQLISFEVDYEYSTSGDIIVHGFYAEAVLFDESGWRSTLKVPAWMHSLLWAEVEDYKYDMVEITA